MNQKEKGKENEPIEQTELNEQQETIENICHKTKHIYISENRKEDLLSFITPGNLETNICCSIRKEIRQNNTNIITGHISGNFFHCYQTYNTKTYTICEISVNVNDKYDIKVIVNKNEYKIKNYTDINENFIHFFTNYINDLWKLYEYVNENYDLYFKRNLSQLCIQGSRICNHNSCCECECPRKNKYRFDYVESKYVVYERDEKKAEFESICELDSWIELQQYKKKCCVCCCC